MQTSTNINRSHSIADNYFNKINTEEKAYWLGFIWADGSISKTAKRASGPNRLRVTQKWAEKEHLQKFINAIASNYKIKKVTRVSNHEIAQLDINCRPLCESLESLGYGPKNIRIHIPNIQRYLIPHFIRGYFDGDGCLSIYTQQIKTWSIPRQEWSITGNKTLISEIKYILSNDAKTTKNVSIKTYKHSPETVSLRYGKKGDIIKLYDYLYKNATVYLETKHKKFVQFFSR